MGVYDEKAINWHPEQLTTWIAPTDTYPGRLAWSAVGLVDVEFARAFANDVLAKCDIVEQLRKENECNNKAEPHNTNEISSETTE